MSVFKNPFHGDADRKMTKEELIQAIRLDIAGVFEAIYLYDAHAQATDDIIAKKIICRIRDQEKAHVGELMTLLRLLDPEEAELFAFGELEVQEVLEELDLLKASAERRLESNPLENVLLRMIRKIPVVVFE
jgi:uncharacterized protein